MNLFITTFESVAMLLGIGLVGFWIMKRRILPGDILGLLSPLAIDIALPSLIFVNIISHFSPTESPEWWQLPLWWLVFTGIAAGLTVMAMTMSRKSTRREFGMSLFYQNGIFFPLAILTGIMGNESSYLTYLFLFALFFPAFFFSTYHLFFGGRGKRVEWKKILHPVLIATLVAIGIGLAGVQEHVPNFLVSMLRLLGGMALPLIMIILGGNIYIDLQKKGRLYIAEIIKYVLVKNIIFPLVFLSLLAVIRPDYGIGLIILLQSAVPPVTSVPLFTERAGGNRAIVNQFVVASFIASLGSIPIMVSLFETIFAAP